MIGLRRKMWNKHLDLEYAEWLHWSSAATMNDSDSRPVSWIAVASVALAVLSLGGVIFHPLALLAIPGVACGVIALRETRRYELGGRRLVHWAMPLSLVIGIGGPLLELAFYRSEAPAGYRRVNYASGPDGILDQYVGQNVCLKGYALGSGGADVDRFVITHSGYSRAENPVLVELASGEQWEPTSGGVAVSGRMELLPEQPDISGYPRYVLRDAIVRPSRTIYQLAARDMSEGC